MIILSIETSCDETAVSLMDASGSAKEPYFKVLGNALYSQALTHAEYGGVFPALAKREHARNLVPMLHSCIEDAKASDLGTTKVNLSEEKIKEISTILEREPGLSELFLTFVEEHELPNIDAIAVTSGPGLEPALWVGINFARALSVALDKPIIPVNHMEGHIVSVLIESSLETTNAQTKSTQTALRPTVEFPALALLISGGHTELVNIEGWHKYKVLGATKDDAVGEAFDKVARLLNLQYPGGPKISKLAAESRSQNMTAKIEKETGSRPWNFPRPMIKSPDYDFSFSGLKTSVLYAVKKINTDTSNISNGESDTASDRPRQPRELTDTERATLCEEFENAVTEVLVEKTKRAIKETRAKTLILGGGVVANTFIRKNFEELVYELSYRHDETSKQGDIKLFVPSIDLSTDNSVMIGIAGYLRYVADPKDSILPAGAVLKEANGNLSL